ncbi:PglL family O-oligosaccharyltransferase [Lelliottia wanjuensis]|uniref:PglL family O-oligosaccharyltransferase n=1 Tax=Lelliottia wanjuensis TaxID=3050585 RepID=UPI00254B0971|nr:Wzy polymerase domain-containing protein [Lelliottia sp. V86_10]MDK9584425.1 Wzy polymerase domain-containing protein [Lelliottia sp. V86_10]
MVIVLFVSIFISLCLYIPSSGGQGVYFPFNLVMVGIYGIAIIMLWRSSNKRRVVNPQPFIKLGYLLLLLPWLVSVQRSPGVIILLLAGVALWLLSRVSIRAGSKKKILQAIFVLALVECAIGLIQTFLPNLALHWFEYNWLRNQGRPFGIFQQVNLFGSFLATGMGCGFLLLVQEKRALLRRSYVCGLCLMAFILMLNQSRTGQLGAILIIILLALLFTFQEPSRVLASISPMLVCALAGVWVVHHITVNVDGQLYTLGRDYSASTHIRMNILKVTWQMIMDKPWMGWGYGAFSAQFTRYMAAHPELNPGHLGGWIPHPHNELLFAWFQGGVIAFSGVVLLVLGWLKNMVVALQKGKLAAGYSLLIIPLGVHLNLEYPFYQSFFHLGVFVLLLRLGMVESAVNWESVERYKTGKIGSLVATVSAVVLVGYSAIGLYTNAQLTHYERVGLADFPATLPWYFYTQPRRAEFDSMVALLVDYNVTHQEADLSRFMVWSAQWIKRNTDTNVLLSRIMIMRYRGDIRGAQEMQHLYDVIKSPVQQGPRG